jgi:hypothetical protein
MKKQALIFAVLMTISLLCGAQGWEEQQAPESRLISNSYSWFYEGRWFTATISVSRSDYEYYLHLSKDMPYGRYCEEYEGRRYLARVAGQLDGIAARQGYSGMREAGFILSFVHSIPYKSDPVRPNGGDYPRFPIETLAESTFGSDCEDHAVLACALLSTLGQDVVLVDLWKSSHMAAAIACDSAASYYMHYGRKYAFMETVPCGLGIGEQPPKYRRETVGLIDVPRVASYRRGNGLTPDPPTHRDWEQEWEREDYERIQSDGISSYGLSICVTSDWRLTVTLNGRILIDI